MASLKFARNGIYKLVMALSILLLGIASCGAPSSDNTPSTEKEAATSAELGSTGSDSAEQSFEQVQATAEPTPTAIPEPTADPNLLAAGTYKVGIDLEPGIYTGEAGVGLFDSCYWERLSDLSGDFSAILSNANAEGKFYLEVLPSDVAIKIGCEMKKYDESTAQHTITDTIQVGTYLVGKDIEPGIYKGMAGTNTMDSCYWQRSSGLTGDMGEIRANDNGVGPYFVEILADDLAFTTGCVLEKFDMNSAATDPFPTTITPGTYIIGKDISAGTYKGKTGADIMDSCYWVRLSSLDGEFGGILANDNATGQFYVQVLESDLALKTACPLEYTGQ